MKTKKGGNKWNYVVENLEFIKDYLATRVPTIEMVATKEDVKNFVTNDDFKKEIAIIKNTMVTKEYLDIKLADLRGDLVLLTSKEDAKVKHLVNILKNKKVITKNEAEQVFKMEPFAQI